MNIACALTWVLMAWLGAAVVASAQNRWIFVNGQRMTDSQVANLERRACTAIPDGNYWLNTQTGAWGYVGNSRVQGTFGEACVRQQNPKSLSERRQLYRPGEILSR